MTITAVFIVLPNLRVYHLIIKKFDSNFRLVANFPRSILWALDRIFLGSQMALPVHRYKFPATNKKTDVVGELRERGQHFLLLLLRSLGRVEGGLIRRRMTRKL